MLDFIHTARHMSPALLTSCLPDESYQPSFDMVVPPSILELGLAELVSIYSELCELGTPPPVIDAADLQENPEVCGTFDTLQVTVFDSVHYFIERCSF